MKWTMQDDHLVMHHPVGEIFWAMPAGFVLPNPSILSLAEYILLTPYGERVEVIPASQSWHGRTAVAFSGGVDSAAALRLLEEPIPIYTQVANPRGQHKLDNALLAVEEVSALAVRSNQDELPTFYGKPRGFYGTAGWTTTSILLAEHLELRVFADGNILEFVYLRGSHGHGTEYRPRDHSPIRAEFAKLGFEYSMPCAGLTEVSTTRVASGFEYAMGCMRGTGGVPCMNCMKCYRKLAVQGTPIAINRDVERVLSKDWIPVLATFLWARDNVGLSHPVLDSINRDYSWVDKWLPAAIEHVPEEGRAYFVRQLERYGIESLRDDSALRCWSAQVR